MVSSLSEYSKKTDSFNPKDRFEIFIADLYELKEKFESNYYGRAEYRKYDKARAFNIHLNAVLFEVNNLLSPPDFLLHPIPSSSENNAKKDLKKHDIVSDDTYMHFKNKIRNLEKELNVLIR